MKLDRYIKITLSVIAFLLLLVVFQLKTQSDIAFAQSKSSPSQWQISAAGLPGNPTSVLYVLDTKNGDIWAYEMERHYAPEYPEYIGRITELGKPVVKNK